MYDISSRSLSNGLNDIQLHVAAMYLPRMVTLKEILSCLRHFQ